MTKCNIIDWKSDHKENIVMPTSQGQWTLNGISFWLILFLMLRLKGPTKLNIYQSS